MKNWCEEPSSNEVMTEMGWDDLKAIPCNEQLIIKNWPSKYLMLLNQSAWAYSLIKVMEFKANLLEMNYSFPFKAYSSFL